MTAQLLIILSNTVVFPDVELALYSTTFFNAYCDEEKQVIRLHTQPVRVANLHNKSYGELKTTFRII